MSYRDELFDRIFGGAIYLQGSNVPFTIFDNALFRNNFGLRGAAMKFNKGGAIYIKDSQFVFEQQAAGMLPEHAFETAMLEIFTTYNCTLEQKFLFEREVHETQISNMTNTFGQVYFLGTESTLLNF